MNIFGKICSVFIRNKQLSILLFIAIILWGGISFWIMPKQYNPDIVAPAFMIQVDFPNATLQEVYQLVTKPQEDVFNEIPGVENIYSKSYQGGKSVVMVEFFVGEDLEKSMITLRQKMSSRLNFAPLGINDPFIASIDPEDLPVKTLVLHSKKLNAVDLRKAGQSLKQDLKAIDGAAWIDVKGGRQREIKIILDPAKLAKTKTTLSEIQDALSKTSFLKGLGYIKGQDDYFVVETQEQTRNINEIKEIVIASNYEKFLRIKDIAIVLEGEEEHESYIGFHKKDKNIQDAVFLSISKLKGSNIINVSKKIDQKIEDLKKRKDYLKDVSIEVVKDEGRIAKEEVSGLVFNLIQAIFIVFIVLLGFLNGRAAVIVAISIPITLLTVLAIGNLAGYTINRITLFALILSLGLLVDSATVVIENIVSNKKENPCMLKEDLVPKAVSEVGAGLFMSTVTTVLAFIPMLFVTGMMGPYMGPIPFFVSVALVVALIFSYSLNPWMAYVFCKDEIPDEIESKCGIVCSVMKKMMDFYKKNLTVLLNNQKVRRKFLVICLILLMVVMSFPILKWLRFRMLPKADREQVYVYMDLDRGVSLEKTKVTADKAISVLLKEKEVKSVQSFVGDAPILDFNGLFRGASDRKMTNQITLKLNLTHPDMRSSASEDLAYHYREVLQKEFKGRADLRLMLVEDPPGPPVKSTFLLKLKSDNEFLLYKAAKKMEAEAKTLREVKDVDVSFQEEHQKFVVSVDKEAAAKAQVSVESISNELETIFSGRKIGVYHSDYNNEQEYVVLRLDRNYRDNIDDLSKINIANAKGNHIPLSRFVKIEEKLQEDIILSDNREQVVYVSGEMGKRSVTYAAIDMLFKMNQFKLEGHEVELQKCSLLSAEYLVDKKHRLSIAIDGEWDLTVICFRDLGTAMGVAIVLIYLVLVAQFRSFVVPLLIMITIPLAMIGVIPGFMILFLLGRVYFSATSMIGVIALAGIVVNNAIILVEYIKQIVPKHNSLSEVLLDAGSTRMRPIMLTSLTTILGSLVIASDPVWSGLAWSIVFGLSLSSVLTLIVFPTLIAEFLGDKWFTKIRS